MLTPASAPELEIVDVGEQLLMGEQDLLEGAHEGQRLLTVEVIREAGAGQLSAIEERLDPGPDEVEILGVGGRARHGQRAAHAIAGHEPVGEAARAGVLERVVSRDRDIGATEGRATEGEGLLGRARVVSSAQVIRVSIEQLSTGFEVQLRRDPLIGDGWIEVWVDPPARVAELAKAKLCLDFRERIGLADVA